MEFQIQVQMKVPTLVMEEKETIHIQTKEDPFKMSDDFELNQGVKDVIHDELKNTYFLTLGNEKIVFYPLLLFKVRETLSRVGREKRNLLINEVQVK